MFYMFYGVFLIRTPHADRYPLSSLHQEQFDFEIGSCLLIVNDGTSVSNNIK